MVDCVNALSEECWPDVNKCIDTIDSNFNNFDSARYMKSVCMPLMNSLKFAL